VATRFTIKAEATTTLKPDRTSFMGYDKLKSSSRVSHLFDQESFKPVDSAGKGQKVAVVLDKTPFYREMGGQVGDTGKITADSGQIDISDTVWSPYGDLAEGAIVHIGQVVKGTVSVGDSVEAEVDLARRFDIARNHTATHLLQAALRQVLGSHVHQRGSLVHPDGFRFDFSQLTAISKQQLGEIQHIVNERIRENLSVRSKEVPYKQAIQEGAIALFEEKYGETVRVLEIGDPPMSAELCGGTHVKSTGEIGFFIITGESSIGTGLRRIEAITGRKAERFVRDSLSTVATAAQELSSSPSEVINKLKALVSELAAERKRSASLERELSRYTVESLLGKTEQVNGITVLSAKVPSTSLPTLREMGDLLKDQLKSAVIVLGTVHDGKPGFVAMVTPDLVNRGLHAGDIVKQVAGVTGGSGGGKADMAQAGGKDKNKLDEALELVKRLVQKISG
jgi:alanyl-tRNA synthetase